MKNSLFTQTALVAAAGLGLAGAAQAQTKEVPVGVTVGGYLSYAYKFQDRNNSPTQRDRSSQALNSDSEIWFSIRGVLDNGTVVGGRVELEGQTESDQIDETYIFVERHDIGRLEAGATDRASSKMLYAAPSAIPGYGTIDPTGAISITNAPSGARTSGNLMKFSSIDDNDGVNVYTSADRYFGSKTGKGLQLGFSYTPNGCQDFSGCGGGFSSTVDAGQVSKVYTAAANYIESFGPVDVGVYAGYYRFSIEANNAGSLSSGSATVFKSDGLDGWSTGTTLTYNIGDGSSVQLGGGYKREDTGVTTTGDDKRQVYSAGVRYLTNGSNPGSIGVGVDYANTKADQGNIAGTAVGGEDKYTWYSAGVTYQVAKGVLTFAGVGRYEYQDAIAAGTVVNGTAQADNDSKTTFGVVGMRLDF